MAITETDSTKGIREAFRLLAKAQVFVGVPSDEDQPHLGTDVGTSERKDDGSGNRQLSNAELAYIHTYGAPEVGIPARPFLEPGIKAVQEQILERSRDAIEAAFAGHTEAVDKNLDAIGLIAQASARNEIVQGIPPPLKPATVARRMRRTKGSAYKRKATVKAQKEFIEQFEQQNMMEGVGSMSGSPTTPLLDTAQLLHAISYVKRKG